MKRTETDKTPAPFLAAMRTTPPSCSLTLPIQPALTATFIPPAMRHNRQPTVCLIAVMARMVVFGVAVLAGCQSSAPSATVEATRARGFDDSASISDLRQQAMIAVRFKAYRAAGLISEEFTSEALGLLPLNDAVRFLVSDSLDHLQGRSRRRRALALLAGYGSSSPEAVSGWQTLAGASESTTDIQDIALDPSLKPEERERRIYALLGREHSHAGEVAASPFVIPGCGPWASDAAVDGLNTIKTNAMAMVQISRKIDKARESLDPQSWDDCSPYFCPPPRTYLVKDGWAETQVTCSGLGNIPPPVAATPLPKGSIYTARDLYEHASCRRCESEFKNILTISTSYGNPLCEGLKLEECTHGTIAYEACYSLRHAFGACALGKSPRLKQDMGHLSVCDIPDDQHDDLIEVCAFKTLLFDKDYANDGSYLLYALYKIEQVNALAELACCPRDGEINAGCN